MVKQKFYAVHNGREGTRIYTTWEEVSRYSGAIHKSFRSLAEARAWLLGIADAAKERPSTSVHVDPGAQSSQFDIGIPMDVEAPAPADNESPEEERIQLSPEQQAALNMVKQGRNVFFTGSAGTPVRNLAGEIGLDMGHRNGKVCFVARDHQATRRTSQCQARSDCFNRYSIPQHRRVHVAFLGRHRPWERGQGRARWEDPGYLEEGVYGRESETRRVVGQEGSWHCAQ
ncbi:hypothetical protein FKP32DRAFT_1579535 [Trametes sanguinea]|nr:hypothetical protein FKP32DRAFT_1579535 [Trametes sanguinea]